jgi:hypothetical protein
MTLMRGDGAVNMTGELFDRVNAAIQPGDRIETLSTKQTNWIAGVNRDGVYVETARSRDRGTGPQHVPAWMITRAWEHLHSNGELSQVFLLNQLNVKRSAFVCALFALFPDVVVESSRPVQLQLIGARDSAEAGRP